MYCTHFGLNRQPFNNTPDPTFYYSTPEHEEALATLQYATLQRKSFVLVTGEIGAGKTLIGRMFLRQLGNEVTSAVIAHTNLTGSQLLAAICREFELDVPSDASNVELIEQLQAFLLEQFARDRYVVVLIDEGQNMPDESFEELRMLGNLEADDAKLLQVCILGQPELRDKFRQPSMRQLDQRMFRRFHLPALDRGQTAHYIIHRLKVAGAVREDIFTTEAMDKIFAASGGVPRVVNQICDNALLTAYGKGEQQVTDEIVAEILEHDILPVPTKAAEYRGELIHSSKSASESDTVGVAPHVPSPSSPSPTEIPAPIKQQLRNIGRRQKQAAHVAQDALHRTQTVEQKLETVATAQTPMRQELDEVTSRQREIGRIVEESTNKWQAHRRQFQNYRREVQQNLDQLRQQCQQTQEKLERLTVNSGDTGLQDVRQESLSSVESIIKQIDRQRSEFQSLLDGAEKRWSETRSKLLELSADAVTHLNITELEARLDGRMQDLLTQIEEHRNRLNQAGGSIQQQCVQLQLDIAALEERQQRANFELARQMNARLDESNETTQGALREKADRADVESLSEQQVQQGKQIEAIRQEKADVDTLQQVVQQQAQAQSKLREELSAEVADVCGQLDTNKADQAEFEQFQQEQAQCHHQIDARLERKADREELAVVREIQQADQQRISQVQQKLESARQELSGELACKADTEVVRALEARQTEEHEQILQHMQRKVESAQEQLTGELARKADTEQVRALEAHQAEAREQILRHVQRKVESTQEELADELTRKAEELTGELARKANVEQVRALEARQAEEHGQILQQMQQKVESTREELAGELTRKADTEDVRALEAHQVEDRVELLQRLQQKVESARQELAGELVKKADSTAVQALQKSQAENRVRVLKQVRQKLEATHQELADKLARKADVVQVQALETKQAEDRVSVLQHMQERLTEAKKNLEQQLDSKASAADLEVARTFQARSQARLAEQINSQIAQGRQEIDQQLRDKAAVGDLDALRELHEQHAGEMLRLIEGRRQEVGQLIENVMQRCQTAQEQIEVLQADEQQDRQDIAVAQQRHEEDLAHLLLQLQEQKKLMDEQIGQLVERSVQTRQELENLQSTAASADELEQVRTQQAQNMQQIVAALESQHHELNALLDSVNQRCDELTARANALPAHIATAEQLASVREDYGREIQRVTQEIADRRRELEESITQVSQHCDQTQEAVQQLASKAADKEEVDTLRVIQAQHHSEMLDRLDKQHIDHAEKVESLNRRWQALTESIDALASITTPTSTFEAAEQSFTRNLQNIREELVQLNAEQRQQVAELLNRIGQQTQRIETLETMDRPAPVKIELAPREQAELRELIAQARLAKSEMVEIMGGAMRMTEELKHTSGDVSQSMQGWVENAGQMRSESEQLRLSAQTASDILKAMQNCSSMIDAKLKSEAWKQELARAEKLTARLEKATRQGRDLHTELLTALSRGEETAAECHREADSWTHRKREAEVITQRLARLLLHSSKASQRFGQMFNTIAGNTTGLAQIISEAREFDEKRQATAKSKTAKPHIVEGDRVDWPALRTHVQVG